MKLALYKFNFFVFVFLLLTSSNIKAQAADPATVPVYSTSGTITLDGVLNEADWSKTYPYLLFGKNAVNYTGIGRTPTGDAVVKGPYTDSSITKVRFLQNGLDLYISLESDDKQVCKFDWEGDGMFMKMKDATGAEKEFKFYVRRDSATAPWQLGNDGAPALSFEGKGIVNGTIYDSASVDNGYIAEMVVHLDKLGFVSAPSVLDININIFDPDNYSVPDLPWGTSGSYYKQWWGSEWGTNRQITLNNSAKNIDPASINVYPTSGAITLNGVLSEADWSQPYPYIKFQYGGVGTGDAYSPTSGWIVKGKYDDPSTTNVRFLQNGLDLYISLESDDKQVCKFDWEGDGMFMKMKDATGAEKEFKFYVRRDSATAPWQLGNDGAPALSFEGKGIVNGTIYDSASVDNGYIAEMVVHLDKLGFVTAPSVLDININIFDPDNYSVPDLPWGTSGSYYKQWWGSEWGTNRQIKLNNIVPVELTSFSASTTQSGVELKWSTATETNNKGFEVQRSSDNKTFNLISFVNGKGTTTSIQHYNYVDASVLSGKYFYRLRQIDFDGTSKFSNVVEAGEIAPSTFELSQNFPNPFNPVTNIKFSVASVQLVTLKVFNILGKEVAVLVNEKKEPGNYSVNFSATYLASGTYFYRLQAGAFVQTKKMVILK
ncbi:MAG: T9SS type A sorting domain-containing protein [Ignavibacteriaceae bacterium]